VIVGALAFSGPVRLVAASGFCCGQLVGPRGHFGWLGARTPLNASRLAVWRWCWRILADHSRMRRPSSPKRPFLRPSVRLCRRWSLQAALFAGAAGGPVPPAGPAATLMVVCPLSNGVAEGATRLDRDLLIAHLVVKRLDRMRRTSAVAVSSPGAGNEAGHQFSFIFYASPRPHAGFF